MFKTKKLFIWLSVLVIILPFIIYMAQKRLRLTPTAAGPVQISVLPHPVNIPPDQTMSVNIAAGTEQVVFARVDLTFDKTLLNLVGDITTPAGDTIQKSSVSEANSTGKITIALAVPPGSSPMTGNIEFARLMFRSVRSTPTTTSINISNLTTQVVNTSSTALGLSLNAATINLNHVSNSGASVSFVPNSASLSPNANLLLHVSAPRSTVFAHVEFSFDPSLVNLAGNIIPQGPLTRVVDISTPNVANAQGKARIVVALPPSGRQNPPSGEFDIASIPLKAVSLVTNQSTQLVITKVQLVESDGTVLPANVFPAELRLNPLVTQPPGSTITPTRPQSTPAPTQPGGGGGGDDDDDDDDGDDGDND